MSDLQRSFAKAKLAHLPPMPPDLVSEEDVEAEEDDQIMAMHHHPDDDSSSSASSASSTGTIIPTPSQNLFARPKLGASGAAAPKRSMDPIPWTSYFEQELYLEHVTDTDCLTFHVYITCPKNSGPLFVTHHGAGTSGLSFGVLMAELRKILPDAGMLSLDARGHGDTVSRASEGDQPTEGAATLLDLSLDKLSSDLLAVIHLVQAKMSWDALPEVILVGHSLGGAVVTDVAKRGDLGAKVLGYAVLDVVEGSAMDALQSMQSYLSARPSSFGSVSEAIQWHIRSRTIRNLTSARTSVPALLTRLSPSSSTDPSAIYSWRTDLSSTQFYWDGWFGGLSSKFLSAPGGKLLLLAGTDRLDKELMIGQMQGKYQLQVFPDAGHFIHEDIPEKTAKVLVDFYRRNDRSSLVLPPKVGELLSQGKKP
ncbi:MAG: Protein phosphatase methylesterase 1 [Caeruleum heppii]|nr:MAG: Protein phosphatase methylesterase 1 [Caeruleum heppii]